MGNSNRKSERGIEKGEIEKVGDSKRERNRTKDYRWGDRDGGEHKERGQSLRKEEREREIDGERDRGG